jgi:hypothetical protein
MQPLHPGTDRNVVGLCELSGKTGPNLFSTGPNLFGPNLFSTGPNLKTGPNLFSQGEAEGAVCAGGPPPVPTFNNESSFGDECPQNGSRKKAGITLGRHLWGAG